MRRLLAAAAIAAAIATTPAHTVTDRAVCVAVTYDVRTGDTLTYIQTRDGRVYGTRDYDDIFPADVVQVERDALGRVTEFGRYVGWVSVDESGAADIHTQYDPTTDTWDAVPLGW